MRPHNISLAALVVGVALAVAGAASGPGHAASTSAKASGQAADAGRDRQPRITNGQVTNRRVTTALPDTVRSIVAEQTGVAWIAYGVPVKSSDREMCCWSSEAPCCGSCRIEPREETGPSSVSRGISPQGSDAGRVMLEGSDRIVVLLRVAERQVERVRVYSDGCVLDAGGRPVHWLDDVQPVASIALLQSLAGSAHERKSRVTTGALSALAQHDEPEAAQALEHLARTHTVPAVRGDAIFWLSQKAGRKAAGAITEAIEKDPETEVKRRAVFALSQLPKGEGVPLLIDIARKNTNPVVRKQAIFWLGQSRDPRAIEFFSEILR